MNKTLFFVPLLILAGSLAVFSASAQEATITPQNSSDAVISQEEITTKDLGVENPGILPTSPFYFLKEWRRGITKFFTFDPVKKAELETEEANERAAEIKKIEEIAPQNIEVIRNAAENYQENVGRLKQRLEALKETSQNPNVDKLIDKLVDRSIKHQELFDYLEKKFEERPELKERLEANREKINELISKVPEKFENIEAFKKRLEKKIESRPEGPFKELRAVEILDRIKEKLSEQEQEKIQELKENLVERFENRIEKLKESEKVKILAPEVLEKLPGDQLRRMEILEEIRSGMTKPEIQEKIKEAREKILEEKIEKREIGKEEIEKMIQEVKDLIIKIENETANLKTEIRQSVKMLLEKSKFHLAEAEKSLAEGKIGEAFGRATSAGAAAKNAWRQMQIQRQEERETKPQIPSKPCPLDAKICPDGSSVGRIGPNCEFAPCPGGANDKVCAQVITPAKNPRTGECKEFPTPCDVPGNWKRVERCGSDNGAEETETFLPKPIQRIFQSAPLRSSQQ
jgi:hypothetical protein